VYITFKPYLHLTKKPLANFANRWRCQLEFTAHFDGGVRWSSPAFTASLMATVLPFAYGEHC
jgi:hypothetical protein